MNKTIISKSDKLDNILYPFIGYCDSFSFVIRADFKTSSLTIGLLDKLKKNLINKDIVSSWPGTELLLDQAEIFFYKLNRQTVELVVETDNNLFSWCSPKLPEDIIMYKEKRPVFVSITHEKDAYFLLDEEEINVFGFND